MSSGTNQQVLERLARLTEAMADMMEPQAAMARRVEGALGQVDRRLEALERRLAGAPVPDLLQAAMEHYNNVFPNEGFPFLQGLQPEDQPVAVALLDRAVAAGRPLSSWQIMAALGLPEPPDGMRL
jgi:hypothetical protein